MSKENSQKKFTLIPDKKKKILGGVLDFRGEGEKYREPFWFLVSVLFFLAIWGAFLLWGVFIQSSQDKVEQERQAFESETNSSDRIQLESFVERLNAIETHINTAKYPSEFMSLFNETVPPHITIRSLDFNVDEATLEIGAFTPRSGSGGGLSEYEGQFIFWRDHNSDIIAHTTRGEWGQTAEGVEFSVSFDIRPATLLRNASVTLSREQSQQSNPINTPIQNTNPLPTPVTLPESESEDDSTQLPES